MLQLIRQKSVSLFLLFSLSVSIHLLSWFPELVESWYSRPLYPAISGALRKIFQFLPFSAGDLFYLGLVLYLLWKTVSRIRQWRGEGFSWKHSGKPALSVVRFLLVLYIFFNALWGLNYNRMGIQSQMDFTREPYSKEELIQINQLLLDSVNYYKEIVIIKNLNYPPTRILFKEAVSAYTGASGKYTFLHYAPAAVKRSLFNILGNYFGFSGYYNPFTGEAQVNTDVPEFLLPYVTCHEIAHQLGYAKENEANFVGFIAATSSDNPLFKYSAYFDLFLYANRSLNRADPVSSKELAEKLNPGIKEDINILKAYYTKYENPAEPVFRWIYGKYLIANDQPLGMVTYSEVVADLIAWHKKSGRIGG